jgi:hypothetical protein
MRLLDSGIKHSLRRAADRDERAATMELNLMALKANDDIKILRPLSDSQAMVWIEAQFDLARRIGQSVAQ